MTKLAHYALYKAIHHLLREESNTSHGSPPRGKGGARSGIWCVLLEREESNTSHGSPPRNKRVPTVWLQMPGRCNSSAPLF